MKRLILALALIASPVWAADYIAVHNGPQGDEDGSSVANGMSLQGAINACTNAGDRAIMAATGTYNISSTSLTSSTPGNGTLAAPKWVIGANASGVVDGTYAVVTGTTHLFNTFTYWNMRYIQWSPTNGYANFALTGTCLHISDCSYIVSSSSTAYAGFNGLKQSILQRFTMQNTYASASSGELLLLYSSQNFGNLLVDCYVDNLGTGFGHPNRGTVFIRCVAVDCGIGFTSQSNNEVCTAIIDCIAYNCTTGINVQGPMGVSGCTLVDCTDGIVMNNSAYSRASIVGCIIAYNSDYGIQLGASGAEVSQLLEQYNVFYSNSSGNLSSGTISRTSTNSDPLFTNRATDDYSVTTASPALQIAMPFTGHRATSYMDAGALLPQITSGGSGAIVISPRRHGN